jgi:hypothetical protein
MRVCRCDEFDPPLCRKDLTGLGPGWKCRGLATELAFPVEPVEGLQDWFMPVVEDRRCPRGVVLIVGEKNAVAYVPGLGVVEVPRG